MDSNTNQPTTQGNASDFEARLTAAFGPQCGLNADWSVSAWCVCSTDGPNRGSGLYIYDNEDDQTLDLVRRDFSREDECEGIASVRYFRVDEIIAAANTRRNALKVANEAARRAFGDAGKTRIYVATDATNGHVKVIFPKWLAIEVIHLWMDNPDTSRGDDAAQATVLEEDDRNETETIDL